MNEVINGYIQYNPLGSRGASLMRSVVKDLERLKPYVLPSLKD